MSSKVKITCKPENVEKILKKLKYKTNPFSITLEIEDLEDNYNYLCNSEGDIQEWKFENRSTFKENENGTVEEENIYHPIPLEVFKNSLGSEEAMSIFLMSFWEIYLNSPAIKFGSNSWRKLIETKTKALRWPDTPMNIRSLAERLFKILQSHPKIKEKYDFISYNLALVYKMNVGNDYKQFEKIILSYHED